MLRAIIIDDDESNISSLSEKLFKHFPEVEVIARLDNGADGIESIDTLMPDVVFLDIEMPVMNGFAMLQRLNFRDFELIFVTAYDHYAIKAIRFSALDYLVKPVEIEELREAIGRVSMNRLNRRTNAQVNVLLDYILKKPAKRLPVPTSDGICYVEFDDIIYLAADNNYTIINLVKGQRLLASRTLKDFEELLPAELFLRIHHSHIINKNYVERYIRGEGGQVIMRNGVVLDVSKRKKSEMLKSLGY